MSAHIDDSELEAFAQELETAASQVKQAVRPTLSKAGMNVKNAYQAQAGAAHRLRFIKPSISYDLIDDGLSVEIGPDRQRSPGAGLAGFFFGWPGGGGGQGDLDGPLEEEAERLGKYASDAIRDLL